ncbi:MAG: ABC transporter permease [Acidobacteria bacterium]|nr:ABC transporter permease [Acidobacteriota bacterium]
MKLQQIGIVYRKELRDTLRDRRTLISMVVVPILLMPILIFGMATITIRLVEKARSEGSSVMLLGSEHAPELAVEIENHEGITVIPPAEDFVRRIENKDLRVAVEFPPGFESRLETGTDSSDLEVKIYHYEGELRSTFALRTMQSILRNYRDRVVEKRLKDRHLSTEILQPFQTVASNVASPEKVGGQLTGGLIPYLIIMLCLTGAMYPAIDLTAGEKERGTIETILASPVSRGALATGKFLTVLTASVSTAVLSLLSLGVTLRLAPLFVEIGSQKGKQLFQFAMSFSGVVAVFAMIIPLAVMFSAALLAIALLAKSYKEAQSYISPLMILVMLPSLVSILPGIELSRLLVWIPVLNVSLVSKDILSGTFQWDRIALIFLSSSVYAAGALWVAARAFQRESVLFRT